MRYRDLYQEEREELKGVARDICESIKKNNIPTIVALDKLGRPAGLLISHTYKQLYPHEKQPKVFFLNPGYSGARKIEEDSIPIEEGVVRRNPSLQKYIKKTPDQPIMIVDEYSHSGRTIERVKRMLEYSGAKNIHSATLSDNKNANQRLPGLFINHPWSGRSGVREIEGRTFTDYSSDRKEALKLRQELKDIAKEIEPKEESKPKKVLERLVASVLTISGLSLLSYPDLTTTGNVIAKQSFANSDLGFIIAVISMIIGGILFFRSFKD
jgi:hypoxanthine phosphoribosyltransferase